MGNLHLLKDATSNDSKENLWDEFLGGDLKALEQIFYTYYEDMYGYGLKLSTRPELTKDCIHELFVRLWERRESLSKVNSVKAYLLASLRRSLLKKIKKKRKYFNDDKEPKEAASQIHFSPEVILIQEELKAEKLESLYKALDQLPIRQKEVLYLKYFNGMSYDEIEEILPIKYQSIKNHVYRAISKLREFLEDDISKIAMILLPFCAFL